ncbi:NmrA family transcriptional regulator, partial [Kitasatospora sp. NPDC001574]
RPARRDRTGPRRREPAGRPRAEARAQMLAFMPEPVVEGTLAILGEPLPAEQAISPDVERVLGRAPRTFAQWAGRTAPAFR